MGRSKYSEVSEMKILNFGSLNLDHVYHVDHFVLPGETLASSQLQHFCGGKGLNQSIALARAGANVYHAGAIGKDGLILKGQLEKDGVNIQNLRICENVGTGHAIIQVDRSGQNCILLYGGANQSITKEQIDYTLNQFEKGDILLLQNEINNMQYLMEEAHKIGLRIFLNPSPCDSFIEKLPLEYVDTFLLNEVEAKQIAKEKTLIQMFPKAKIVLTLSSKGAKYIDFNQEIFQPATKVNAIDTTGAGDTFTGYYIAAISQGKSMHVALKQASIAAAISVTKNGAVPSIPYKKDVLQFDK